METIPVTLEGKYAGWEAVMDGDPDWGVFEELESGSIARMTAALAGLVVSWNFKDKSGEEVPADVAGLRRVPISAVRELIRQYGTYFRALPNQAAGA